MVWRTVLGTHPAQGQIGLFVSKPGYDAASADLNDTNPWMFNSYKDLIANVIQSGTCGLETPVYHPGGSGAFLPYILFDRWVSSSNTAYDNETIEDANSAGSASRYRVVHATPSQFSIVRNVPAIDQSFQGVFRYMCLSLPW